MKLNESALAILNLFIFLLCTEINVDNCMAHLHTIMTKPQFNTKYNDIVSDRVASWLLCLTLKHAT